MMSEAFRAAAKGLWLDTIARDAFLMRIFRRNLEGLLWTKKWGFPESSEHLV